MKFYIDCEWNSYKGELISMALVSEQGHAFYEVLELPEEIDPWVMDNVIPVLGKRSVSVSRAKDNLRNFLSNVTSVHIIADWPEDIARFCDFIITGPGERLDTPPLTFEVLRVDSKSVTPHNALADANGLKAHCEALSTRLTGIMPCPAKVELEKEVSEKWDQLVDFVNRLHESQRAAPDGFRVDQEANRWISIGKTHIQQGLMALDRAIRKPDGL